MGQKKIWRAKQPAKMSSGRETEDSIDAVDQINGDLDFVMETLRLMGAASLRREAWPEISLVHITEEMRVRLERVGKLCNRFLAHGSKDRRV